jgi:hypothetical protein
LGYDLGQPCTICVEQKKMIERLSTVDEASPDERGWCCHARLSSGFIHSDALYTNRSGVSVMMAPLRLGPAAWLPLHAGGPPGAATAALRAGAGVHLRADPAGTQPARSRCPSITIMGLLHVDHE